MPRLKTPTLIFLAHRLGDSGAWHSHQLGSGEDLLVDGIIVAGIHAGRRDDMARQEARNWGGARPAPQKLAFERTTKDSQELP
jgi:hypothetical protein